MAQQTQLMAALVDSMNHCNGGGGRPDDFQRKLEGFLKLRPPTFDGTDLEPLAAHDWLREIEKKLDLTTCTDEECVGIAAHQLTGAARSWWDSYSDAHEDPEHISWDEFVEAFTEYHIPEGVLDSKEDEFRNLRQKGDTVHEYTTHFTTLLRYAPPSVVASEREKIHHYRKGLNPKIKVALGGAKSRTLRDLIDRSIQIEKDQIEAGEESRREKRRFEFSHRGRD